MMSLGGNPSPPDFARAVEAWSEAFGLLGSMYLCMPSRGAFGNWRSILRGNDVPILADLRKAAEGVRTESEEEMRDLLWDFTKLFIGPYKLPCPPWESVYTSPKKLLMQEAYDAVTKFYREAGLSVGDPKVHADHVGAELCFLGALYGKMERDPEMALRYREIAERFRAEHLTGWIPRFSADMEKAADSRFYKVVARTTRDLVAATLVPSKKGNAALAMGGESGVAV